MRNAVAILMVVGAGCGGDTGPTSPVKIGLLAPKTGALMQVGESFERVAQVAVDSINGKGGVDGRPLELLVEDTETTASTAGAKLQGLIDLGAVAVVGPATSGEVTNAFPIARDNKVPIISPSSTAPSLSRTATAGGPDDDGYMFRNVPDDEIQGLAMAYYIKQRREPAVASVAVVYENSPYGSGLKNAFKTSFEDLGGSVTFEVSFEQNLTDVPAAKPTIDALVNAPNRPSFVILVALEQDAVKLVQAWDNSGSPLIPGMQFFMTDGARSSGFLSAAPASVHQMCGTAPTFPIRGLAYRQLQDAYEAAFTDKIGDQVFAPNVWDAVHLFAASMVQQRHAHPDEDVGGEHLRDAITAVSKDGQTFHSGQWRDLIASLRAGNDVDYDGAAGPNDFDVVGQAVGPYEVWCVSDDGASFTQALFLEAKDVQALKP
ncbi:MAG TPA: ABC transporter substrate-binding protein [Kofleriaceae bacterium]|jgi:ABC-type branched-subunit amino acid transport system substrate-binding protein|nr:ABC transporter substrate-binding protein [Kofleriaceae bacterium]